MGDGGQKVQIFSYQVVDPGVIMYSTGEKQFILLQLNLKV